MKNSHDPAGSDTIESHRLYPIAGVPTSITAFIGRAVQGPVNTPITVASFSDFEQIFGGLWRDSTLGYAVRDFFCNRGMHAVVVRLVGGDADEQALQMHDDFLPLYAEDERKGLYALDKLDLFNILCIPPYTAPLPGLDVEPELVAIAASYCERRRAILVTDAPGSWKSARAAKEGIAALGCTSANAALYFPRIIEPDPLREHQYRELPACGALAGLFARFDAQLGVWKAPAGTEATLLGVSGLTVPLTGEESRDLNAIGINCLRNVSDVGPVVWGARTLAGDGGNSFEWEYVAVRRLTLYIEESISRGIQWAFFEVNNELLWAKIRLNVSEFMHGLFVRGALAGQMPQEAYFVKCDKETTSPTDINEGNVNVMIGFAPTKRAEFIVLKFQQRAGQTPSPPR